MAEERGLKVDVEEYTSLMDAQKARGRQDRPRSGTAAGELLDQVRDFAASRFVGYETTDSVAVVDRVVNGRYISLDQTPFYVESGGQVDDIGVIEGENFLAEVVGSRKIEDRIIHEIRVLKGDPQSAPGMMVKAHVDHQRRLNIQRNHSATHLVHEALRRVLGPHVHQQGSLVAPDRLRFDFPHFARISQDELRAIEDLVNEKIALDIPVYTEVDIPFDRAKKIPNVKMFFGDKYGDTVRVVFIDEKFSIEFCGGTHVRTTSDIGRFKIVSESSIASGVRRIEAVTGEGVLRHIEEQVQKATELDRRIELLLQERDLLLNDLGMKNAREVQRPSLGTIQSSVVTSSDDLGSVEAGVHERQSVIGDLTHELQQLRKRASAASVQHAAAALDTLIANAVSVQGIRIVASRVEAGDMDDLKRIGDALRSKLGSGVGLLGAVLQEKVALVCVVTDDLLASKRYHAGTVVGAVARRLGGGGGGKPHMATAGAKDTAHLDEVLSQFSSIIEAL
jgi:alanyl-tRNA synthetase